MKKIFITIIAFSVLFLPAFLYAAQNQQGIHDPGTGLENPELQTEEGRSLKQGQDSSGQAVMRRSQVAESVQAMERVATNNQGIGEQIRVIAQNQNRVQEEAEEVLGAAKKRGGLTRFFIGPDYKKLNTTEEKLNEHLQNVNELKELRKEIQQLSDQEVIDEQVEAMENIVDEMRGEVVNERKRFSLFGWLLKLFN